MPVLISFIVPVYNEKESIVFTVEELKRVAAKIAKPYEIILVNDGSTDGTREIISRIKDILAVDHPVNLGYGASLKTGIRLSLGAYIAIIDADQTYPAARFSDLFEQISDADMVVGSRTGASVRVPFLRRPAKWILNTLSTALTRQNIPDLNSGMRIFKKELALRFFKLFPDEFSFTTTITIAALCNNYAVKFVPIDYHKRKGVSSIHPLKDFVGFFQLIIRMVIYFKPLNFFAPISLIFFTVGAVKMMIDAARLGHFGIGGVALVLMAIQLLFLGLLADLIIKRTEL